jgi:photosystem II stability/assembly factor-like uncharacterized protein
MKILICILLCAGWPVSVGTAGGRTVVSVFIVRGSVSGSPTGSFGAFARNGGDTTWTKLTPSNVITFGLGHFERGATRRLYVAGGNGVLRSTDEGKSWRILTSWQTMEILSVALDPADSSMILAATPRGVYKSADDGMTWALKAKGMSRWFVQKLHRDVGTSGTYYAAVEDGLYRSTDRGESWRRLPLPADQIQVIAQNPVSPTSLGAAAEDRGIWLSHDGGRSWEQCAELRGETIYALRFSPDGREIYAAGWKTGIWRSRNGGKEWTKLWSDPAVEAVFDVVVDPADPAHVLAGTDGQGVYESRDAGRSWHRAGLMGAKVKQIEIIP